MDVGEYIHSQMEGSKGSFIMLIMSKFITSNICLLEKDVSNELIFLVYDLTFNNFMFIDHVDNSCRTNLHTK